MSDKKQGILYIITAAFCFACMSFFIRMSGDLPTIQKSFFRNVVAMIVAFVMIIKSKEDFKIGEGNFKYLLFRSIGGTIGLLFNFYAIDHMNIADANMLNKLSPFFAIIMSTFILGEFASLIEWLIVIVAFVGALFVIKPSFDMSVVPALIGAFGGFAAGTAYTFVRKLGMRGERGHMIVLFFSTFSCLFTLPFVIFDYHPMSLRQFGFLILTGISAAGGQLAITKAYTKAPAKEISVYDYSQVIFAAVLGYVFLGQVIDLHSIIGYVIIIGAAIARWFYGLKKE